MVEKFKVIITPEAQEDIRNSIRYIARELANPQAAMALQEELATLACLEPADLENGWLKRLVRVIVNSGRWQQTRSAFAVH